MMASWTDKSGNTYMVKCWVKMATHGAGCPTFGGIVTNTILHGSSGIGTALIPIEYVRGKNYLLDTDDEVTPTRPFPPDRAARDARSAQGHVSKNRPCRPGSSSPVASSGRFGTSCSITKKSASSRGSDMSKIAAVAMPVATVTYEHTFTRTGTYKYFCIPHEAAGMVGTVSVQPKKRGDILMYKKGIFRRCAVGGALAALLIGTGTATAAPTTFNYLLLPSQKFLLRQQYIGRQRDDDTKVPGRDVGIHGVISTLAYEISPDWLVLAAVPYLYKKLNVTTPKGRIKRTTQGFGDTALAVRDILYRKRFSDGGKLLAGPVARVVVPTGDADDRDRFGLKPRTFQLSSGAFGGGVGSYLSYQRPRYEFDSFASYTFYGTHNGYSAGNQATVEASFQYKAATVPGFGTGKPGKLNVVLESNLRYADKDHLDGQNLPRTGGTRWFIDPGLQYVTKRYAIEAAVLVPAVQDVPRGGFKDDYIVRVGYRVNF